MTEHEQQRRAKIIADLTKRIRQVEADVQEVNDMKQLTGLDQLVALVNITYKDIKRRIQNHA